MRRLIRLFFVLLLTLMVSETTFAKRPQVYVTVESEAIVKIKKHKHYKSKTVCRVNSGDTLKILKPAGYWTDWVKVRVPDGPRGYILEDYIKEDFYPEYIRQLNEPTAYSLYVKKITKSAEDRFVYAKERIRTTWVLVAIAFVLSCMLIRGIRKFDPYFDRPLIHYLLYLVSIFPTWAIFYISVEFSYKYTFGENLLLCAMMIVSSMLTINGGWGVRQSGMLEGKYFYSPNMWVGQILLFPVWMMITAVLWHTFATPVFEWAGTLEYQGGGFWRFMIGLTVLWVMCAAVFYVMMGYIIPLFLRTVGNLPLYIMMIVLWFAMLKLSYLWIYANFNSFAFLFALFIIAVIYLGLLSSVLQELEATRCPMCHYCYAVQTGKVDLGIKIRVKTGWRSINDSDINPEHTNAKVSDAREKVQTVIHDHEWRTEHTCPKCDCKWQMMHSEEVESHSRVLERRHTETYPKY